MPQTMSVTEARDNFPALVRRVAEQDEPVVVTSHNQPKAVLMRWETYQAQQQAQVEGARYRLAHCVTTMEQLAGGLLEAYRPDSFDLEYGTQDLLRLAREAWSITRLLDTPRRDLASLLTDVLLILLEHKGQLTEAQLERILAAIPLLHQDDLTDEVVAKVDRTLLQVGLSSIFPMTDAEVAQYLTLIEEPA
ncbi:MAG: type II toxin-antitoxin system Phd/YefM family antitoxin [Caldilinea sp. CFX5]|nr:type II toxin-antitoxin system Phd/YefM family antitoxin [Caldilinea sp. CFX5]